MRADGGRLQRRDRGRSAMAAPGSGPGTCGPEAPLAAAVPRPLTPPHTRHSAFRDREGRSGVLWRNVPLMCGTLQGVRVRVLGFLCVRAAPERSGTEFVDVV